MLDTLREMTCVIPFHSGDHGSVAELLRWIQLLGGCPRQSALLVADAGVQWGHAIDLLDLANQTFQSATVITNDRPVEGWLEGSNSLFLTAAQHIEESGKEPWLWLEPDAIPLKSGWLDRIQFVYSHASKPFMGWVYTFENPQPPIAPFPIMSGVAVYPHDAWSKLVKAIRFAPNLAFDVASASITVPNAAHTNLIQHFYGEKNLAPTFSESKSESSPRNTFTLDRIHKDAMLWHRCKDGSLMRLLHQKMFHVESPQRFVVILPFCNKDALPMIKVLRWMNRLGKCPMDSAILAYDNATRTEHIRDILALASQCFGKVSTFIYGAPRRTDVTGAAKHAFRCVAGHMRGIGKPWLWFEADMVPTKKGWLDRLQEGYARAGKPFFGPVIPDMGHFNGTAVYPADTFNRCPSLSIENNDAWDTGIKEETKGQVADASALIQHAWVMANGRMLPHGSGDYPMFRTVNDVQRMLWPSAVCFHRDKTLSLIDRLTEMGVA